MIYIFKDEARETAECYDDKTIKRAPREAAQILANVLDYYGVTNENHKPNKAYPELTKWVARSRSNWTWFIKLGYALCYEYSFRTGKVHASQEYITWARNHPPYNQPEMGRQPFPYSEKAMKEIDPRFFKDQLSSWQFLFVMKNDGLKDKDYTFRKLPEFYKQRLNELASIEALREAKKSGEKQ